MIAQFVCIAFLGFFAYVPALWETFGEHRNIGQLAGHKNAVTCLAWVSVSGDDRLLVSGSADGTLVLWKTSTGERIRRLRGHRGIVNSVACTRSGDGCIASASDDGRVLFWDLESRYPISSLELGYPVTCVEFSDDAAQLFVGGVDNAIHVIDLATKERVYSLLGHTNSVTSLSLSRTGTHLLSCGLDDTVRVWDVRPYAAPKVDAKGNARLHRTLLGMASGFENLLLKVAWSPDGECVACGGADHTSNIWNVEKGTLLFKLPGHRGTCTAVDFHPQEPILVSASTDCTMLLGELDSD